MKMKENAARVLSLLFMGLGQIYTGFYLKGIILAIIEVGFLYYYKWFLLSFDKFYTLGTLKSKLIGFDYVAGDNSILLLFNGIVALIIFIFFIMFYIMNIIDAGRCAKYVEDSKTPPATMLYVKEFYNRKFVIIMLIPAIIGTLAFALLPIILTVLVSFTNFSGPNHIPPRNLFQWVGLSNFFKLVTIKAWRTTFFGVGLWTIIFAVLSTVFTYGTGLILAILTKVNGIKFNFLWRGIFILPYSIPAFVSLLVFRLLLTPSGPINNFFHVSIPFLSDPIYAKVVILVVSTWLGAPYFMVLLSGALTNISESLYEAAKIDGAGPVQRFFKITLPIVIFQTTPVMIMTFAYNLSNFGTIYFLTNGWPPDSSYRYAGSTDLLLTWVFKMTKDQGQYSFASVITLIVFSVVASISLLIFLKSKSYKNEGMLS